MAKQLEVTVPDIGDFEEVDVIEILVAVGDTVAVEDPLVTLESEKATMDIPAPEAGKIADIRVAVGDKISEGGVIVVIETAQDDAPEEPGSPDADRQQSAAAADEPAADEPAADEPAADEPAAAAEPQPATAEPAAESTTDSATVSVTVPDIGDFEDVEVIDILVTPGDSVELDDPLITLESDKATMDIPAPVAGTVKDIRVAIGDRVSEGHEIVTLASAAAPATGGGETRAAPAAAAPPTATQSEPDAAPAAQAPPSTPAPADPPTRTDAAPAYASPSVRKFARELGVELNQVTGSGRKGRITKPDVKAHVKSRLAAGNEGRAGGSLSVTPLPTIDFAKFGPIETLELTKIRRLTGENLHRSWVLAPHVTQFDEADITDLEAFRQAKRDDAAAQGVKLTPLAFLIKAVVVALKKFPDFNASLSADGKSIVRKQYFHIGVAVNTEQGLVVPVLRDADQKGLYQLAGELRELTVKAREKKLAPADMQGGCFTISSLGGVGGTMFTPIINVPEVAILGVSPSSMKPVYRDGEFVPRLMLPLALSYDHRVIDGVAGAQFTSELAAVLGDIRNILL
jgi:pyruvate dehydrogenase E2 component (dihydrolipoamide acetyltransferase)